MEILADFGYIGLFLSSFLAATVLPLSSEVVLGMLLLNDYNSGALVGIATTGNVMGALVNYALGFWGSRCVKRRKRVVTNIGLEKARQRFKKYGVISLLFAWVPVIGDPLTVIAGVLKINIFVFLILVTAGKLARYLMIAFVF